MIETNVLAVNAEMHPQPGVREPGPNQLYRNPKLSIRNRNLSALAPGCIRVEMLLAGICGTDVHVVQTTPKTGYILGTAPISIPSSGRVLGHEGVGRVIECGSGVLNVKTGDYVTFESILTCQTCKPCRSGHFNQCRNARLFGLEHDGLFGHIVDVPASLVHDVSSLAESEYGLTAACCVEPAGVGFVAATATQVSPGDNVLIFGAGPIGTFTAMLCREVFGAAEIHVVEPIPFRRKFAAKWASHVYDTETFYGAIISDAIDVIIEASGAVDNVSKAFRRLAPNGRVTLLARSGMPLAVQHVDHMITNTITISGSRGHLGGAFHNLLHLIRIGRLALHEAVTDTVLGLNSVKKCLETPKKFLDDNCKVLVKLSDT